MVVLICLSWFQCIYLSYFNKIGFLGTLMHRIFYFLCFWCMPANGAAVLRMAYEKLLRVLVFPDWDCFGLYTVNGP